jgi:hypothetical protein
MFQSRFACARFDTPLASVRKKMGTVARVEGEFLPARFRREPDLEALTANPLQDSDSSWPQAILLARTSHGEENVVCMEIAFCYLP